MLLERGGSAPDGQHLFGQPVRSTTSSLNRTRGSRFDVDETLLDLLADDLLERLPGCGRKRCRALRDDVCNGFAGAFRRVRCGFLHLDHGVDQRRTGFVAETRCLALRFGDGCRQRAKSLAGIADAFVQRREQGREPVLLFRNTRRRCSDPVARLDRRLAHPVELRPDLLRRPDQPLRTRFGIADGV